MSETPDGRPVRLRAEASALRARFEGQGGPAYWKSLDELARTPEFEEFVQREFPPGASEWDDPAGRRGFLKLMGASLALAGLSSACTRQPEERIVPYVKTPEGVVPGRPLHFASSLQDGGYARGVLVESHEGRPTKIEGNPEHPSSLGGSDALGQAEILNLYDPDRSQTVLNLGEIRGFGDFISAIKPLMDAQRTVKGAGLRILSGLVTSPTLAKQLEDLLKELPEAKWHQWDPLARDGAHAGALLAFGEPVDARYDFEKADVIVSLDADFVSSGPGRLRHVREFARRRKVSGHHAELNRLYVVESTPSLAGSVADHRLPLRPAEVELFARALAQAAGLGVATGSVSPELQRFAEAVARDLRAHAGRGLVLAGDSQPAAVHALAHALNQELGNAGSTVTYSAPLLARPVEAASSLRELVDDLEAGKVSLLVILGCNPVYDAPADLGFAKAAERAGIRVHLGLYQDETALQCHWHVPAAHALESWSDARAHDGTLGIVQPLIAPLYGGRSPHELLSVLQGRGERAGYETLRESWKALLDGQDFEARWNRALHDGVLAGSALPAKTVTARLGEWAQVAPKAPAAGLDVLFRPDPNVLDGRYSNNGWLQELPRPLTKLTWENAVLVGPRLAQRLGISVSATARGTTTDVVEVRVGEKAVRGPAFVVPGQHEECVTLFLGYGRAHAGRVGTGIGFDVYPLRTQLAAWSAAGGALAKTGARAMLACTQDHWTLEAENDRAAESRQLVRAVTVAEYNQNPEIVREKGEDPPQGLSLYAPWKYEGHAWGMAIDMSACVGCNACVVACTSENNIPVVGKDQVARGREMHWIRVDRYYRGSPERPEALETYHQPMTCHHCENAPCEVVCPVAATTHSDEGLNDMVYNRCVGTRYCSNNCPYKVRRFNFFLYQDWTTPSLKAMRNPDVTVRSRGVMEKCSYCAQRINQVRIDAKNQGRPIEDGEIQTACQQACPAEAIVFGDLNDPQSRVARLKAEPRNYGLLTELGTRPRTSYLAPVKNPNPELA
ncbi:MAG: TAT-variant-translocated molybdopterin oxidoreductase [Vicinamibacteria bacterium]